MLESKEKSSVQHETAELPCPIAISHRYSTLNLRSIKRKRRTNVVNEKKSNDVPISRNRLKYAIEFPKKKVEIHALEFQFFILIAE